MERVILLDDLVSALSQIQGPFVSPVVMHKFVAALALYCLISVPAALAGEPLLTLSQVIDSAIQKNPELGATRSSAEAAQAQSSAAPSIPPPELFVGAMGMQPLSSSGQMENSIGVRQMIPFPTKLTAESKEKSLEARAAGSRLEARILEITAEAKEVYFELYGIRKKIELLEEKKKIFEDHSKRLRASALSDRIVQAHRLWAQTETALIENDLIAAHESERVGQGKLNIVMGLSPDQSIAKLEDPAPSSLPKDQTLSPSHPELQSAEYAKAAADKALSGSRSLWLPDLSLQYRSAKRFDGLMSNYSEVMVGVTLPFLFFWEAKGKVSAAHARAQTAAFQLEKVRLDLQQDVFESRVRAESLRAQLTNYDTKIIPQAEKRGKIAHGLVPSDPESLREHREAMESLVQLRLAQVAIRVDYEKSVAKLQRLLAKGTVPEKAQP
ncbi:MAG: TolC family protein [Bdellovibrionales bacterium]|nr:TolC family protein [Bdellovibrionales bacterium]